jgi:putative ABC transport system permease protein
MLGPRWKKVLRDLWGNKTRTTLVVLSIAVGVFAVGVIATSRVLLSEGLERSYQATNPASAMMMVSDPFFGGGDVGFDDELVQVVRNMDGVEEAEGRRKATVRLKVGPDAWRDLQVFAIPDYEDIRINKVSPEHGAWPPDDHALLIERSAMGLLGRQVGDTLTIKTAGGDLREMPLSGVVHDLSQLPSFLDGTIYGYVTFDTLEWLGEPRSYNELYLVVSEGKDDRMNPPQATPLEWQWLGGFLAGFSPPNGTLATTSPTWYHWFRSPTHKPKAHGQTRGSQASGAHLSNVSVSGSIGEPSDG